MCEIITNNFFFFNICVLLFLERRNSLIGRTTKGENRLSFSACFDEQTIVHCSVVPLTPSLVHMIFSTVSLVFPFFFFFSFFFFLFLSIFLFIPPITQPWRVPLQSEIATSLAYQEALTSASAVVFGTAQVCFSFL